MDGSAVAESRSVFLTLRVQRKFSNVGSSISSILKDVDAAVVDAAVVDAAVVDDAVVDAAFVDDTVVDNAVDFAVVDVPEVVDDNETSVVVDDDDRLSLCQLVDDFVFHVVVGDVLEVILTDDVVGHLVSGELISGNPIIAKLHVVENFILQTSMIAVHLFFLRVSAKSSVSTNVPGERHLVSTNLFSERHLRVRFPGDDEAEFLHHHRHLARMTSLQVIHDAR